MIDVAASVEEQRSGQGVAVPGWGSMVKTKSDVARYVRLLHDVQPAWVVELGSFNGASACFFANTASCQVVSIDNHPQVGDEARAHPLVSFLTGNSADPAIVAHVSTLIGTEGPVVVICDSDHSADHVYAELCAYSPLVSPGSYCIAEDTVIRWVPEQLPFYKHSGPLDAVEKFLAEHPEFENDDAIEGMSPTSQSPGGWLRRVS